MWGPAKDRLKGAVFQNVWVSPSKVTQIVLLRMQPSALKPLG